MTSDFGTKDYFTEDGSIPIEGLEKYCPGPQNFGQSNVRADNRMSHRRTEEYWSRELQMIGGEKQNIGGEAGSICTGQEEGRILSYCPEETRCGQEEGRIFCRVKVGYGTV
jgi:hypothetical protein